MTTLLGIAGSLRAGSYNAALLRAASELAPAGSQVTIASIRGIPLYDADVESETGIPDTVTALKGHIMAADGVLLATPEYNGSLPGVLKNAIDWLSRPGKDVPAVFGNRPVALVGATPGAGGTRLAQAAWLPVLRNLGMRPWFGKLLYVTGAAQAFDASGRLVDEKIRELVTQFIAGFVSFVNRED